METKQLTIRDFERCPKGVLFRCNADGEIIKFDRLKGGSAAQVVVATATLPFPIDFPISELSPIPITPEILPLMFGWKPEAFAGDVWWDISDNLVIVKFGDKFRIRYKDQFGNAVAVEFIHELQSFLAGVKLPYEVEWAKIGGAK